MILRFKDKVISNYEYSHLVITYLLFSMNKKPGTRNHKPETFIFQIHGKEGCQVVSTTVVFLDQ